MENNNYRPFKNVNEAFDAVQEYGAWFCIDSEHPIYQILSLNLDDVTYYDRYKGIKHMDYFEMLERCAFMDGTPFGYPKINDTLRKF